VKEDFIKNNQEFWAEFKFKNGHTKLLIEESYSPMITHANAIFSLILNQAKFLIPVWLYYNEEDFKLLKTYLPAAEFQMQPRLTVFQKFKMVVISIYKFIYICITKDILSFFYDGVKYGDVVYDAYLFRNQVATVRRINLKILLIIYSCIKRHIQIRNILKSSNYSGVLVSHQVGYSGIMLRTALRYGYKGYLRAGHHQSSFQCIKNLEDIYTHEYRPSPKDIDNIIAKLENRFDEFYQFIFNRHVSGLGNKDALCAFSKDNKYYKSRYSFNQNYNLNQKKKNVFVMLHAFTDFPHSGFTWMLFKDYYDWFMKTLKFAKKNKRVNWVFKQHPSIKYYPTKDVSFNEIFSNCPENVVYIGSEDRIDTRSLTCCADLIVTCLGSAGFELPAMAGIPSVTAGDNLYTGLGFALEPKTKKEYFEILDNAHNIKYLTPEQQKRAKATCMYIYHFAKVDVSACPMLSFKDEKDKDIASWYWSRVKELYAVREEKIKNEIKNYIYQVSNHKFRRLNIDLP